MAAGTHNLHTNIAQLLQACGVCIHLVTIHDIPSLYSDQSVRLNKTPTEGVPSAKRVTTDGHR